MDVSLRDGRRVRPVLAPLTEPVVVTSETYDCMAPNYVITRPSGGGLPELWDQRDLKVVA